MPQRIAVLIPHFDALGIAKSMLTLAGELARRGFAVDFLAGTLDPPAPFPIPPGVRLRGAGLFPRTSDTPELCRYLSRERPDALFSSGHWPNVAAIRARERTGVSCKIVVRNTIHVSTHLAHQPSVLRSVAREIARDYSRADAIVAPSRGVADDVARLGGLPLESVHVIPNPYDLERITREAAQDPGHAWFAPGAPPVIVGTGKLEPRKGFDLLLRAFARLRRERAARLVLLGEGPARHDLERLAQQLGIARDVELPGFDPSPFRYMRRAAVFVLSSSHEGLPNVLIEALACGTPVVSTDCPSGPREILQDGRWGRLAPVDDVAALAQAMADTLDRPPDRAALMERAKDFAAPRIAAQWLKLVGLAPGGLGFAEPDSID